MWSAPAEQSSDGALELPTNNSIGSSRIQSGVALRLPPRSKVAFLLLPQGYDARNSLQVFVNVQDFPHALVDQMFDSLMLIESNLK